MEFYDLTPVGRIINRFSKDVDVIDILVPKSLDNWTRCVVRVLSTLFIISYSTPIFLAALVPIGLLYYVVQVLKLKLFHRNLYENKHMK